MKSTFLKYHFPPISIINFSSDLIKFEDYIKKFLNSLWIRPIFTIIPLNLSEFSKIGKFGIIFDAIPCEIDDLAVLSRHATWDFQLHDSIEIVDLHLKARGTWRDLICRESF